MSGIFVAIAHQRIHVTFPFEEAMINTIIVSLKKDPIVFGLKILRIIIENGGVCKLAAIRIKIDD